MNYEKFTPRTMLRVLLIVIALASGGWALLAAEWKSGKIYPEPLIVDPGPPGGPPADATVLFDGKDMSAWNGADDWEVKDGVVTVNPKSPEKQAGATTKQSFGDCQLHVEWAEPDAVKGSSQGRGNSGVFLMNRYEVQVLDSYHNLTYYDGQCGAIYKQSPPLVNVCRKPGEWQTYDIIFEAPWFDEKGKLSKPAYITVLQNGVLVQNHTEIQGSTSWDHPPTYEAHAYKAPVQLQNHGNPVRFRNIWIRELTPKPFIESAKPASE
ncbi:MAG TPA: DUF1080 domain-containing protein [Pirellulales bacterium]|jgi:hypothetical protein|nr:DUF1080 domain-containing protein [Pirellulales bacterium]